MDDVLKNGFKSLFNVAKNFATGTEQIVEDKVKFERKAICEGCPKLLATRQCGECLCFIDLKTTLKQEKCPLSKWDKID